VLRIAAFLSALIALFVQAQAADTIFDAALAGDVLQVKAFVQNGASVQGLDSLRSTLLHYAAMSKNPEAGELIDYLIAQGLSVTAMNTDGFTPLHSCAIAGIGPIAARLIGYGASLTARDQQQHTPLNCTAMQGNFDVARVLIANGADVNDQNSNKWTPLRVAKYRNQDRMVEFLQEYGARE
jgi:ankyrin repeat protein